ncbi:AAA family ATPase [Erwinia aphidicola]|nr:AAA family ATPase [Erwinia aphidicola]
MAVLTIRGVRSYGADKDVRIDLSNKVTLIYGQNGSGKSTISNYFSGYYPDKYSQCRFESQAELYPLVFNHDYIERKFCLENVQPGIFTLSDHNKDLQEHIEKNKLRIHKINDLVSRLNQEIDGRTDMEQSLTNECAARMFRRTSSERTLFASFLTGAKQQKGFYDRIKDVLLSDGAFNQEELAARLENLQKSKGTSLAPVAFSSQYTLSSEVEQLIRSPLQPASGTQFAGFIAALGNADWVRAGERFVKDGMCPFCQNPFDVIHFAEEMAKMYDKSYQSSLEAIRDASAATAAHLDELNVLMDRLIRHPAIREDAGIYIPLKLLIKNCQLNLQAMINKLDKPSVIFTPADTTESRDALFRHLEQVNSDIAENNRLAENFDAEMALLNRDIIAYFRQTCDEYLVAHTADLQEVRAQKLKAEQQASALLSERKQLGEETTRLSGQLSVIQPTVDAINASLQVLGVTDFSICCHDEDRKLYRLRRESEPGEEDVFRTLSEGEKTIIALLYFIESCTGNITPEALHDGRKLIVIDDPISSLSHNYIYEVASLIKRRIIKTDIARHLVILTHNMFFFQEILLTAVRRLDNKLDQPKGWSLLRIVKNIHSDIFPLSMHEMLNEYQALWPTLKDVKENKSQLIVLPNTMRNILEYYFSFSCKEEKLEKTLEALAVTYAAGRYDSFYRAINRHSHSDGRNILGSGIMEKEQYFDLFRKIFEETGDLRHYCAMMNEDEMA